MTPSLISLAQLSVAFIPVAILLVVYVKWSLQVGKPLYAIARMLLQLLIIGYFLTSLFTLQSHYAVLAVLIFMWVVSSWIALHAVNHDKFRLFKMTLISLLAGGGFSLFVVTQGVLVLSPWFSPQVMIPLAGMVFANAMSGISLVAERFFAETQRGVAYEEARNIAFQTAMIPTVNSLFAVGLVALPGMMTGQILSGVDPLIAARYQIMVMFMLLSANGLSAALFLWLLRRQPTK